MHQQKADFGSKIQSAFMTGVMCVFYLANMAGDVHPLHVADTVHVTANGHGVLYFCIWLSPGLALKTLKKKPFLDA